MQNNFELIDLIEFKLLYTIKKNLIMRNEIFSRINQNRIQYYSELKNTQNKTKFDKDYIAEKNIIIEDSIEEFAAKKTIFQPFNSFDYSLIIVLYSTINKKINGWNSFVVENVKKTRDQIASKASIQSNKVTENLSKLSSQLFEDSYEFHGQEDISKVTDQFNDKSLALGLIGSSIGVSVIPLESSRYQLIYQLNRWLYNIYRDILIFLESDSWFEEINRSPNSTHSISCKKSIIFSNNTSRRLKLFNIKEKRTNLNQLDSIDKLINTYKLFYSKCIYILIRLKASLFPAINRFI